MLFEQRFWPLIADGSVTVTFRRWRQRQVVSGRRYRTPAGFIEIDSVESVRASTVTHEDAAAAGYPSAAEMLRGLADRKDVPLYRIDFHYIGGVDPRAELAATDALSADDVAELNRRLDRLDNASTRGAWTRRILTLINERPATRAPDLAASVGLETVVFKRDVRKLKELGLTTSLKIGYQLSPRGEAYLDRSHLR
jgi:hypothetical protein